MQSLSRKRLNKEIVGLLLSGVDELVARGTGKPEVLVLPVAQSSLMRPHRSLCLMKGFKKDKESH